MFGAAWNAAGKTAKWLHVEKLVMLGYAFLRTPPAKRQNGRHARRFPGGPSLVRVASVFLLSLDMIFQLDTFPPQLLINAAGMITP
jgi:hypothetical protein